MHVLPVHHLTTPCHRAAWCATQPGTGADNPSDPTTLSELEKRRALMYAFEDVDHFDVVFIVQRLVPTCCGCRCGWPPGCCVELLNNAYNNA